ncbi:hypothetical protein BT63DRAFT_66979 [Microthyrium microscopicum]|uniref:VPS9 domain-containing protein n=1 Tax=Microthyrium microscopicum TaxID=703497 RepID=A0A6A6U219_9PEZI|nr:hypothetical protein BT63DRAFT_66979 [Microthyrium microscopicum]
MQTSTTTRPVAQTSMSFSRLDSPTSETLSRTQSTTSIASGLGVSDVPFVTGTVTASPTTEVEDVFSSPKEDEVSSPVVGSGQIWPPQGFDDLPIEIRSLSERFLESLSAKVHPTPLSIDALSDLFQDFYMKAEKPISTHVAALSSQLSRNSTSLRKKPNGKPEQQMLTATEISDRKKQRVLLAQKKIGLEEAVERAVCEKVYLKLWHHRSTDDEQMDQKLRSRIAALNLVGIGLKELLISGSEEAPDDLLRKTIEQEDQIKASLESARASIQSMTEEKYPLGKLYHLIDAHKSIVETLSSYFPTNSSADEILPTIIYTLITSSPETINVISDLHFIQRFRNGSKVAGEASYCLVNLEAAISFLETVELPTLRADEPLEGPEKASSTMPPTPRRDTAPMQLGITPADDPLSEPFPTLPGSPDTPQKPLLTANRTSRSLSELLQAPKNILEDASDSFRSTITNSADHAVSTLENFRFFFTRVRETPSNTPEVPVPKTLEDARKLVSTPPLGADPFTSSSPPDQPSPLLEQTLSAKDSRVLDLVGGRRIRDRSADSSRSGSSSGKRVSFAGPSTVDPLAEKALPTLPTPPPASAENAVPPVSPLPLMTHGTAAVESMRNLTNSLNPLNQFAKMSLFGGRSASSPAVPPTSAPTLGTPGADVRPVTPTETKALAAVEEVRKIAKPVKRFIECKDARDLRIGDVEDLLAEYKRLAAALAKVRAE